MIKSSIPTDQANLSIERKSEQQFTNMSISQSSKPSQMYSGKQKRHVLLSGYN